MVETLVFHVRDPKDLIQVSLEDSASAVTFAASYACPRTRRSSRVRLERFGNRPWLWPVATRREGGPLPTRASMSRCFEARRKC